MALRDYETKLRDALTVLDGSTDAWRAFADDEAPHPDAAAHRAAAKLLMQHISEVARQTNIPASTLRRWCANGDILAEKRGRDWFVDVDDAAFWRDTITERRERSQTERRKREQNAGQ